MDWTIGADIEMMLEKGKTLVSAVSLLPADHSPDELPYGGVFHDNVLAEFTVTPAKSHKEFVRNILDNVETIQSMLKDKGVKTRMVASARYPTRALRSEAAKRFGCAPDYCAYELKVNEVAEGADQTNLRTAGGHIHFAHKIFEDPMQIIAMIKLMDLHLGVPSILEDDTPAAAERRHLYGKAGAHRPKNYPGGEYRSLSNFWSKDTRGIEWAYTQTHKCLKLVLAGETVTTLGFDEQEVRRTINEADKDSAEKIIAKLKG